VTVCRWVNHLGM